MASALQNLSQFDADSLPDAEKFEIGIVCADWNSDITHALYEGCYNTLTEQGVAADNIHTVQVPGTFELPTAARLLSTYKKVDAIVCIGCVIKGETDHDIYINTSVAQGLINLSLIKGLPVIFGVLTPNSHEQALDRAGGKHGNKGVEAAVTAIRMAAQYREMTYKDRGISISF